MNTKRILALAGIGALAACMMVPAPALAQQAAGVTVAHLGYRLVDLDPDDGIAPWLGLSSYATQATVRVYDQDGNDIAADAIEHAGNAAFDNGYAAMRAQVEEDAASVQLLLYSGWGYASANRSLRFLLSPHTQVVFSVDADLWASPEAPGASWPTALAELYGSLHGMGDGDWGFSTRAQLEQGAQQGRLSVAAASGGDWVDGYLAFDAYAVAESHALPVPEPAPAAMLLAGLGLAGALGRFARPR